MAQNPVVVEHIEQYGWHLVLVKGDAQRAPFAYTIGLFQSYEHPEVVISGLNADLDVMKIILNNVGHVVREGGSYLANSRADDILEGYTCWFIPVPRPQHEHVVGQALRHYGDQSFPLLQLIWPSPSGFYPWDAELDATNRARQELWGTTEGIALGPVVL